MRASLIVATLLAMLGGCAPSVAPTAAAAAPCDSTIDAIAFTCTDGLTLSVRHDPQTRCVVLFLGENTHVLPFDDTIGANTNGAVTFEQRGSAATLSRITSGAASQCTMVE
ncbi:MAG: hypothetical protein K2X34_03030 [Hyphomonadaceae bacterium]|nr:hypothetical protein [Hyphomonadaceae bacterium]